MDEMHSLNVYGPGAWHDDVYIVGSREALERLHRAVEQALTKGHHEEEFMVGADGEGYGCRIIVVPENEMGPMMVPYTESEIGATENRDNCTKPWELWKQKQP